MAVKGETPLSSPQVCTTLALMVARFEAALVEHPWGPPPPELPPAPASLPRPPFANGRFELHAEQVAAEPGGRPRPPLRIVRRLPSTRGVAA